MDDHERLAELHEQHAGAVRAYVRRRIGDGDADEVVADVFVVAWRRLGELPPQPRSFLLGTARRVLANRYRADGRQRAMLERLAGEARALAPPATGSAPPGAVAGSDEPGHDGAILRGLAALSPDDREVLLLVTWEELSHAEAGEVLGIRPAAAAMRVHRARRRLERALRAEAARTALDETPPSSTPDLAARAAVTARRSPDPAPAPPIPTTASTREADHAC